MARWVLWGGLRRDVHTAERSLPRAAFKRWFWWFILAQNVPDLAYAALAAVGAGKEARSVSLVVLYRGSLGSGFGTAVLDGVLDASVCVSIAPRISALLTALMSLSFTFAGAASGYIAEAVGYQTYFCLHLRRHAADDGARPLRPQVSGERREDPPPSL